MLKKRPPKGNARRVQPIGKNARFELETKAADTLQCESFQELMKAIELESDLNLVRLMSQPEKFYSIDKQARKQPYIADFLAEYRDGAKRYIEVTLEARRSKEAALKREAIGLE